MTSRFADNVTSCSSIAYFADKGCSKTNLRCAANIRVLSKALSCNTSSRVDLVFLDDRCLVTRSDILFVGADSTSWVGAQIFNLSNMSALSFYITQDNALELLRLLSCSSTLSLSSFDKGVLRHEEVISSLLSGKSLAELRVTALSLGNLLLDTGA